MDELLTIPEVAEYLKVSKTKVYTLVRQKQIPHIRIDRNVRIRKSDLENWLDIHYVPSQEIQIGVSHPPFQILDKVEFVPLAG